MPNINYEKDILKHFVRRDGWLPASQEQLRRISGGKRQLNKEPLKYFTFCAAHAIDVFMLEKEKVLKRDKTTGRLNGVYFCEDDPEDFGKIAGLIGSPDQGFLGDFQEIVLFEEDEDTSDRSFSDESAAYGPELRKKLRIKDAHYRFEHAFPFDIINLDVCGTMFPPKKGVFSPLLKAIMKILEWQTKSTFKIKKKSVPASNFTLFLTSHIDPDLTNSDAIAQLKTCLSNNISAVAGFRELFVEKFGTDNVNQFAEELFPEFFCVSFPKHIIDKALHEFNWRVTYQKNYIYNRPDVHSIERNYQMMHSVAVYERLGDNTDQLNVSRLPEYAESVKELLNTGIKHVDENIADEDIQQKLEKDLQTIIKLRDQDKD